jgi:hypothetical protein
MVVSGAPLERRGHARRRLQTAGSNPTIATVGVVPRAALVVDVSPTGLGLLTTFAPLVGSILPVWLPGAPGEASSLVLAHVIHVQPPTENLYRVGAACSDEASTSVLRALYDRLAEAS